MNAPDELWISWNSDEGWHSVNYKDHTSDGLPCVRYIRADALAAQPAPVPVPVEVLDTLDNALNKLAYYVGDSEIKRARAWLDALAAQPAPVPVEEEYLRVIARLKESGWEKNRMGPWYYFRKATAVDAYGALLDVCLPVHPTASDAAFYIASANRLLDALGEPRPAADEDIEFDPYSTTTFTGDE